MFRRILLTFMCLALLAGCAGTPAAVPAAQNSRATTPSAVELPLFFTPNAGQSAEGVLFQARAAAGSLFLTAGQIWLAPGRTSDAVALEFLGRQTGGGVVGTRPLGGKAHYLIGNDPAQWRADLPLYAGVQYTDLYPGIDLEYTGHDGHLKGVYTLAPGADPDLIRWTYRRAEDVTLDETTGDLVIRVGKQTLRELAPVAWQDVDGQRREVAARFVVAAGGSVSFALGDYDATLPLIIDPYLVYATYFGGSSFDEGFAVAVDAQQNVYVVGSSTSANFPGAGQPQPAFGGGDTLGDAFVLKLNATGSSVVYATYLGGSENELGDSIVVDANGAVHISGVTYSDNFPLVNAYQANFNQGNQTCSTPPCPDAFVAKLAPDGNALVFSTYLGGGSYDNSGLVDGGDARGGSAGIDLDAEGNIYVAGMTASDNFPTANAFDSTVGIGTKAFLSKLSADGQTLLYSTYVASEQGNEYSAGVEVQDATRVYVAGFTSSENFPVRSALYGAHTGAHDAFLMRFDTTQTGDASLTYSTYFGGSADDMSYDLALDANGNVYLAGATMSGDMPMQGAYQNFNASVAASYPMPRDAWVAKISADGANLLYSTYLGGDYGDIAYGLAVNSQGDVFLAGYTTSRNFPVKDYWDSYLDTLDRDAFVARIDPTRSGADSLIYSTYIGGNLSSHTAYDAAVDTAANVYLVGRTDWSDLDESFRFTHILGEVASGGGFVMKLSPVIYRTQLPLAMRH